MNLRNIMKKPDPIAPEPPMRVSQNSTPPTRQRRRYPDEPTVQQVQQAQDLFESPRPKPTPVRMTDARYPDKPDRDYFKLALTILIGFFAIGGIAIGAILMTQPGTPNNLAWLHGENAVVLVCVLLLMIKIK